MARPRFKPTAEQRTMVKSMAALGMTHEQITIVLGIRSPKTLRKHLRKQLDAGNAEAIAKVSGVAYEMAQSGKYPRMTQYWLGSHPSTPAEGKFNRRPLRRGRDD